MNKAVASNYKGPTLSLIQNHPYEFIAMRITREDALESINAFLKHVLTAYPSSEPGTMKKFNVKFILMSYMYLAYPDRIFNTTTSAPDYQLHKQLADGLKAPSKVKKPAYFEMDGPVYPDCVENAGHGGCHGEDSGRLSQ